MIKYPMKIYIENLNFDTIIGILEDERTTPQKVYIDSQIEYNYENGDFLNYAHICEFIEIDMKRNSYFLIEDALQEITDKLHIKYPQIRSIILKITKPNILQNAKVAVEIFRNY